MRLVPTPWSLFAFLVGWSTAWLLLWHLVRPRPGPAAAPARTRAVVVPARDEEASLPALLDSVRPQLRPGDELVVVDDHSVDATAAVARAGGAVVVAAPPLPPGWLGKPWACQVGADATTAEVLVFLDADVRLADGALDRLDADEQAHPGALVSVQPWHDVRRPYEHLSLFFNLTALLGTGAVSVLDRRVARRPRAAYGPVLATARTAYRTSGGHAHPDVRGAVAEDLALARRYPAVQVRTGATWAVFRMYPSGLRALVQGWTKNIATGAASVPWWAGAGVVGWLWSLFGAPFSGWLAVGLAVAQVWVLGRRVGRFGLVDAVAYLPLLVFFLAVFLRSVALTALGRPVRWRGRAVATRRPSGGGGAG